MHNERREPRLIVRFPSNPAGRHRCPECGTEFPSADALLRHLRKVHGDPPSPRPDQLLG